MAAQPTAADFIETCENVNLIHKCSLPHLAAGQNSVSSMFSLAPVQTHLPRPCYPPTPRERWFLSFFYFFKTSSSLSRACFFGLGCGCGYYAHTSATIRAELSRLASVRSCPVLRCVVAEFESELLGVSDSAAPGVQSLNANWAKPASRALLPFDQSPLPVWNLLVDNIPVNVLFKLSSSAPTLSFFLLLF